MDIKLFLCIQVGKMVTQLLFSIWGLGLSGSFLVCGKQVLQLLSGGSSSSSGAQISGNTNDKGLFLTSFTKIRLTDISIHIINIALVSTPTSSQKYFSSFVFSCLCSLVILS
jgi:hypothetical protein